jgi:Domain of unknown function (DUF3854)
VNSHLDFLLSCLYDADPLAPGHWADLRKSGIADETIAAQKIRTVAPPYLIERLLGFSTPKVMSAYIIPFPSPAEGFMDHVRMKVFPTIETKSGTIKYLQPKRSGVRLFFPLATLDRALHGREPLWMMEGEKKALAVAQLGLPAVGFCGIEGWHVAGSQDLVPDFNDIDLRGRIVELVPDGDWQTNPNVKRGAERFAVALSRCGAKPRLVALPVEIAA